MCVMLQYVLPTQLNILGQQYILVVNNILGKKTIFFEQKLHTSLKTFFISTKFGFSTI